MGLVEWTRLEGGQTEAVVAMMVNRERPNSIRITPSRGDGGVDILDRREGPDGSDVVYQVKRYTEPLTPKQKTDVKDSLDTLTTDKRWLDLTVKEWHLVTPWNPTPEVEHWLQELAQPHGFTATWHGLDYVEQLAANYGDIIDYYLHGGRTRIQEAYEQVASLMGTTTMPMDLKVPDVSARIEAALATLDHDPHYRYEPRYGEGAPPPPPRAGDRPMLAMHYLSVNETGGRWNSVDVIARCAASFDERPITVKGTLTAEPGSEFAQQLSHFHTFGSPFVSPDGAFQGTLDAPGGLGGELHQAKLWVGPTDNADLGKNIEFHLEILDENDAVVAEVDANCIERSEGIGGGARVLFEESNGAFTIETRGDRVAERGYRTVQFRDPAGLPVGIVRRAFEFVTSLRSPHRLRTSVRHTPPARGLVDPFIGFKWDENVLDQLARQIRIMELLEFLQEHTASVIRLPNVENITPKQLKDWWTAAAILRGEKVTATYPEGHALTLALDPAVTPGSGTLGVVLPFQTMVGDQLIDLGQYVTVLVDPTPIDSTEHEGITYHRFTTPDRTVRFQRHDPDPDPEPSASGSEPSPESPR